MKLILPTCHTQERFPNSAYCLASLGPAEAQSILRQAQACQDFLRQQGSPYFGRVFLEAPISFYFFGDYVEAYSELESGDWLEVPEDFDPATFPFPEFEDGRTSARTECQSIRYGASRSDVYLYALDKNSSAEAKAELPLELLQIIAKKGSVPTNDIDSHGFRAATDKLDHAQ